MAIAVIVQGGTREQYEAIAERVNAEGIPEGAVIHTVAETPEGIRIMDVWESREAFERFMVDRVVPIGEALGMDMSEAPEPEMYELFQVILNQEARV